MRPWKSNYKVRAVVLGVSAGILYCLWFLAYYLNPSALANFDVSALQAKGQPYYWFFIAGDVVTGVLIFLLTLCLIKIFYKTPVWYKASFWVCLVGLMTFGVMTAISCFLPSCVAAASVCNQSTSTVFGAHNVTGGVASFGQFLSLAAALVLAHKKVSDNLYRATYLLLIVWSLCGLIFLYVSERTLPSAQSMQHAFLVLSSLGVAAVAAILANYKHSS